MSERIEGDMKITELPSGAVIREKYNPDPPPQPQQPPPVTLEDILKRLNDIEAKIEAQRP